MPTVLRRPGPPLLLALLGALALALVGAATYLVPLGRARDSAALEGFAALDRPRLNPWLDLVAHLADPGPYALIGLALIAVALARRRPRLAVTVAVLLVLTGATTATLKHAFASPRFEDWIAWPIADASWPSGHATASMTLALLGILVSPARLRPLAAVVGGGFALAVSYAILALRWHLPSDVLGGYLVAGTWIMAALAALNAAERRWPARRPPVDERPPGRADVVAALAVAAAAALGAVAVALRRPDAVASFVDEHTTFVAVAAAIAVLGISLATGLAAGLRTPAR